MKSISIILILFSCCVAGAQSSDEKAVAAAVETLRKALIDADKKTLTEISSTDLSYGHSNGKIEDQAAFIERLVTKDSDFHTIELSEQTIKVVGSTAIVRHRLVATTSDKGVPGNP